MMARTGFVGTQKLPLIRLSRLIVVTMYLTHYVQSREFWLWLAMAMTIGVGDFVERNLWRPKNDFVYWSFHVFLLILKISKFPNYPSCICGFVGGWWLCDVRFFVCFYILQSRLAFSNLRLVWRCQCKADKRLASAGKDGNCLWSYLWGTAFIKSLPDVTFFGLGISLM